MKRLPLFKTCLVLLMVLMLSGVSMGKTVVKYAYWGTPANIKVDQTIISEFERRNPDITIESIHIPTRYEDKLLTMIAGGTAPDVMRVDDYYYPTLADKGVLEDLTEYVERDSSNLNLNDFIPELVEGCKYKGKLYGLPNACAMYSLYYNKSKFNESGLDLPSMSWTWDDLLSAAQKLTVVNPKTGRTEDFGAAFPVQLPDILPWVWQSGGDIIDADMRTPTWNTPEVERAIQFLVDLTHKHGVSPGMSEITAQGTSQMFMTGRVGMIITWKTPVPQFRTIREFEWDIMGLPQGPAGKRSLIKGSKISMSSDSKVKEAAWKFTKFITGEEVDYLYIEEGRYPPRRVSLLSSDAFLESSPPSSNWIYSEEIKHARMIRIPLAWKEMQTEANQLLQDVMLNKIEVSEGLAEIDKRVEAVLNK
ncbi:MAG: sugar ABC transporter substrate-binding protein [Firmicutes bacterium]|nr:sugar ABC transporter substrate-binding protein [Bacillota bacterium]